MLDILFYTDHKKGHMIPTFDLVKKLQNDGMTVNYFGIADAMNEVARMDFQTHTIFEEYFPKGITKSRDRVAHSPILLILDGELDQMMSTLNPKMIFVTAHNPLEALAIYYKYKIKTILFWAHFPKGEYSLINKSPYLDGIQQAAIETIFTHNNPKALTKFIDFVNHGGTKITNLKDLALPYRTFSHFIACSKELLIEKNAHRQDEIYLGPCLSEHDLFDTNDQHLFEEHSFDENTNEKYIYCSMGSWADEINAKKGLQIFKALIDCMKHPKMQHCKLLIAAGELYTALKELDLHENVYLYRWLPQLKIMKYMSVAIIHGGMGSIKECINCQVPMIITPLGLDQFDNAKRVVHHGLGLELDIDSMTTEEIGALLAKAMNTEEWREKLQLMKSFFDRDDASNSGVVYAQKLVSRVNQTIKVEEQA